MFAKIHFEIQEEIIKRVLIKSLIRFRSVSKQWKSLIDSSEFITRHSLNRSRQHHLLVRYRHTELGFKDDYVLIVDDHSFPHHKLSPTFKQDSDASIVCSSHGLVFLRVYTGDIKNRIHKIIIWNPSIRKSVRIQFPSVAWEQALGFGVCPKTGDPKIVKITRKTLEFYKADVFRLSSMAWRSVPINLPHRSINFSYGSDVVDGFIYWIDFVYSPCRHLISFNLTSEEFGEIELPDCLGPSRGLSISTRKECVIVLSRDARNEDCDIWMMLKNDVSKCSFTKLFTLNSPGWITGFRENGQVMTTAKGVNSFEVKELKVYEPYEERCIGLGIYGFIFWITSYTESVLLLNHPHSIKFGFLANMLRSV